MDVDITVLIVGAGPTGLAMAIELLRHDIPFRIIDKKQEPTATSNALGVQPRTLELWDDQELLEEALSAGYTLNGLCIHTKGKKLAQLKTASLPTLYPFILALPQSDTEKMMIAYLKKNGVEVEFKKELLQVSERTEAVNAFIKNSDQEERISAQWLIACDGGHSKVRENLHIAFEGTVLPQHFMMADVIFSSPKIKETAEVYWHNNGPVLIIPYAQNRARIIFDVTKDKTFSQQKTPTDAQLHQAVLTRCKDAMTINEVIWRSGFHIQERILSQYRHNLIFFAGDAAHIHSPAGAQGMNTGIQDAYNLGWKLATVIKGNADISLLDSYHLERFPIARHVLMSSSVITRVITLTNPFWMSIRNLLFKVFSHQKHLARKMVLLISELSINYISSPLSKETVPNRHGPKAGERFCDCYLNQNKTDRLLNYVRGTKPVLLFFSGVQKNQRNKDLINLLSKLHAKYQEIFSYALVTVVDFSNEETQVQIIKDLEQYAHRQYRITAPRLYVVRPDKYISFRGDLADSNALEEYLANLFPKR
jgi:2-polyprenyl-6-methoxyphenol hydroxylase-like FAD-dependent oxidoreductase